MYNLNLKKLINPNNFLYAFMLFNELLKNYSLKNTKEIIKKKRNIAIRDFLTSIFIFKYKAFPHVFLH